MIEDFEVIDLGAMPVLAFPGPFEALSRRYGRLNLLKNIALGPEEVALGLSEESDRIMRRIENFIEKGASFKAAWIWSDLAYKDGLFFSPDFYEKNLFPIHKKLVGFLNSHDLSVIFHSDGKIEALVPYLIEAGVKAFGPIDEYADMDIAKLHETCLRR